MLFLQFASLTMQKTYKICEACMTHEEIWIVYYILKMIYEKRPWSGALCLNHLLLVLWPRFFFLHLLWSLEIALKTNGMVIAALKSFVRPLEAKCLKKPLSHLRLQILKYFEFFEDLWKTALVRGFVCKSFSTRPMTTILFFFYTFCEV